jgi:GAF domain-containing protein/anti-sigma regulatory factor (Ser/Thr protein kinase)
VDAPEPPQDAAPAGSEPADRQLARLEWITEAALAHLTLDDLLDELLERLRALLQVDTAAILLLDPEQGALVARAAKGLEEEVERGVTIPLGAGFGGRIAAEGRPVVLNDVQPEDVVNPLLREKGLRSLMGVPLFVEGDVIGVLHVGTLSPREFGGDDTRLLQLAGDRIALAIDHARLYEAERAARIVAEARLASVRQLESISDAALAHLSLEALMEALLDRVRDFLAADTVAVLLLDSETDELVARAARGLEEEVERGIRIPMGRGFAGRIAAERRPVALEDVEHADVLNPILREKGIHSLLGVPLLVEGEVIGVVHVGSLTPRMFSSQEAELLQRAADRMAIAIDHARLYEAERDARRAAEHTTEQVRQLQTITEAALAHLSFDDEFLEELLERVRAILNTDTAVILLLDPDTDELVARGARGLEESVQRGVRVPVGRGFAGRIAAEGRPVVLDSLEGVEIVNPLLREKGIQSLLGVPLLVEGRVLGVLHVGTVEPRKFTRENSTLLELAADRIAIAIHHARVYEREHRVAETLQRSLLPSRLPQVPGLAAAARYLPGSDESAVGGDWYDVLELGGGRVGLVMGDVVASGVSAASVMGHLRNALRAYALDGHPPALVLERLVRVVRELEGREMATLFYGVLDPAGGTLVYSNAGHPPPLVIDAEGRTRFLEDGRSVPLGALAEALYEQAEERIEPGSTILLYTDGLVERRDMWIAEGLERLEEAAAEPAQASGDELCDRLLSELLDGNVAHDDVALLAVHRLAQPVERLELELPAHADSLFPLRRVMRNWLEPLGASELVIHDVLIATTEAAANAVEHAYGPVEATFHVEAAREEHEVAIAVRDYGRWRPARGYNRGRGTMLMQELMDDFEVTTSEAGTEVRLRRSLEDAA